MTAKIIDVCGALVTAINAGTWSQTITAVRSYLVRRDVKDIGSAWLVSVVPAEETRERDNRSEIKRQFGIDVGIQKRIDMGALTEGDAVLALAEEIADYFDGRRLSSPAAVCIGSDKTAIYVPDHLEQHRVLTAITRFDFLNFS